MTNACSTFWWFQEKFSAGSFIKYMMRTLNYLKNEVSLFDFITSQIDNMKYFQMNVQGANPL